MAAEAGVDEESSSAATEDRPPGPRPYRSRSLPHLLSHHDSGVGCSGSYSGVENAIPTSRTALANRLVADLRQLLTLKQHYYPEGGWGWVIVVVGVLVQVLAHGLQGAGAVLWRETVAKFGRDIHQPAGNIQTLLDVFIFSTLSKTLIPPFTRPLFTRPLFTRVSIYAVSIYCYLKRAGPF